MKKQMITTALMLFFLVNMVWAQAPAGNTNSTDNPVTITISGTVKTQDGDALHLAFVQDKIYKTGIYTDSTGYFSLSVYPNSRLGIRCFGFRDTIIQINGRSSFAIVLKPNVSIKGSKGIEESNADNIGLATIRDQITDDAAANAAHFDRQNHPSPWKNSVIPGLPPSQADASIVTSKNVAAIDGLNANPSTRIPGYGALPPSMSSQPQEGFVDMAQGAIYPVFQHKEATQGSRYLFNSWVHGYLINSSDSVVQSADFVYNYDKISGSLILSKDRHAAIELFKASVKSFTLFDAINQSYTFTMVPQIDRNHYVQVVSSCSDYSIFKQIKTRFVAANYVSDGVASTGNDYDSFENEEIYYILNSKSGQIQKLSLKRKGLKEAFADHIDKLNKFMSENSGDIDDAYLSSLCQYMNAK